MKRIKLLIGGLCYALFGIFCLSTVNAQSVNINFDQVKNGKGVDAGSIIEFIGSELGPNNSTYTEGMSVPQRVQLSNVASTTDDKHVFSFKHQIYDPTKSAFAYDFLTSWQQAVDNGDGLLNTLMTYTSSLGNPTPLTIDDSYFASNLVAGQDISLRTNAYGARTVTIYGNSPISDASLTLTSVEDVNGNLYALYDLKWTSTSTSIDFEFAGHLAVTDGAILGASKVEGASNHIKLEGLDGGGINSRDNQIRLNESQCETSTATAGSNSPVCEGGTLNLTATTITGATYSWTGPNNFTSTDQNPSIENVTTAATGTYTVTITLGGCSSSPSTDVVVNAKPTVNITGATSFCSGGNTVLTANATAGSGTITGYQWYLNGSPINGATSSTYTATAAGSYTITVTNSNTCSATSDAYVVTVNPLPPCTITRTDATSNTSTAGATATFSGPSAPSSTTYTYAWSITNNTSGASFVGGINNTQTVNVKTTTAGSYTLSLTVTDNTTHCSSSPACTYTITVKPIGPSITYTQGFYGNSGGKACNGQYSYQIMLNAVTTAGGSVRFGNQSATDSRSFTLVTADVNNTTKSNIYKMLPGGNTPYALKPAYSSTCPYYTASFAKTCTYPAVPMSSTGSINNVLLAQTMALYFNLYYSNSVGKAIGGLTLPGNVLTFAKPSTACSSTYVAQTTPKTIPCSVYNYLVNNGGATISNLYILANNVLGGVVSTSTVFASDINTAVNVINTGFDGGGQIIGVSSNCTSSKPVTEIQEAPITSLGISAFPNPFTRTVKFTILSPVSGQGSLDIYNLMGQKIYNAYKGYVVAGRKEMIEFNVPSKNNGSLIYSFRVGDRQVNGKLLQMK